MTARATNACSLLAGIVDHRKKDSTVEKKDMIIKHGSNMMQPRKTTKARSLCFEWKEGRTSCWERLANVKESNPVEVADYAVV